MSASEKKYIRQYYVNPTELGLNGVTILAATPVTSSTFSVDGYNQLSLAFSLTRVAATAVTAYVEFSFNGTVWYRQQASSIAAGTETLTDHTMSKAVAGSVLWWHNFGGVIGDRARIVVGSTAGTTDTLQVAAIVGVVS
jgi:hypothetical protein